MKKFKLISAFALFATFILLTNCTRDDSLEVIEERNQIEIDANLNLKEVSDCIGEIVVTFSFPPGTTMNDKIRRKNAYYLRRSRVLDICYRIAGDVDCPDKEKWIVKNYVWPPHGTGDVNEEGGTRGGEIEPWDGQLPGGSTSKNGNNDCFDNGTIILGLIPVLPDLPSNGGDGFDNGDDDGQDGHGNYH